MSIVGNVYLLRGEPVMVTCQWQQQRNRVNLPNIKTSPTTPRNVLVKYEDGREQVRPFRGLRRIKV